MTPHTKATVSKKKGAASLPMRDSRKSAKKTVLSVVTLPALDGISVVWDNAGGGDMLMSMLADLSNKVNG